MGGSCRFLVYPVFCWWLFAFVRDMLVSWCPPSFVDHCLHLYVTGWCLGVPRLLLITVFVRDMHCVLVSPVFCWPLFVFVRDMRFCDLVSPVFCWPLFVFVRDTRCCDLVSPPSFVDHYLYLYVTCWCLGVPRLLLISICICTWHAGVLVSPVFCWSLFVSDIHCCDLVSPGLLLITICICTWHAGVLVSPGFLLITICIGTWHAGVLVFPIFCWSLFASVRDMLVSWCPPSFVDHYLHLWHTLLWLGVPQSFVDHYLHLYVTCWCLGVPHLLLITICICMWHAGVLVFPIFCWSPFAFVLDMCYFVLVSSVRFVDHYLHLYVTSATVSRCPLSFLLITICICTWHALLCLLVSYVLLIVIRIARDLRCLTGLKSRPRRHSKVSSSPPSGTVQSPQQAWWERSADFATRFADPLSSQGGESADVVTRFAVLLCSEGAESADVMLIWLLILRRNMRQGAPERPSEYTNMNYPVHSAFSYLLKHHLNNSTKSYCFLTHHVSRADTLGL